MISKEVLSELEMVAHIGAETASSSLSMLLKQSVSVAVNGVTSVNIEEIPEKMFDSDKLCTALVSRVTGDIEGNAVLLFGEEDALKLIGFLGSSVKSAASFGKLERSMLEETANITISSFMNSMTSHLQHKCLPNAPIFLLDMSGSILSVVLMESAAAGDQAILFSTQFICRQENMHAVFAFLPNPSSLQVIEEGLEDD